MESTNPNISAGASGATGENESNLDPTPTRADVAETNYPAELIEMLQELSAWNQNNLRRSHPFMALRVDGSLKKIIGMVSGAMGLGGAPAGGAGIGSPAFVFQNYDGSTPENASNLGRAYQPGEMDFKQPTKLLGQDLAKVGIPGREIVRPGDLLAQSHEKEQLKQQRDQLYKDLPKMTEDDLIEMAKTKRGQQAIRALAKKVGMPDYKGGFIDVAFLRRLGDLVYAKKTRDTASKTAIEAGERDVDLHPSAGDTPTSLGADLQDAVKDPQDRKMEQQLSELTGGRIPSASELLAKAEADKLQQENDTAAGNATSEGSVPPSATDTTTPGAGQEEGLKQTEPSKTAKPAPKGAGSSTTKKS